MNQLKSRKGFVIEGAIVMAIGLTLLFATVWKPLSNTLGSFIGSQGQNQQKSTYKKSETIPVYWKDNKGKEHLVPYTRKEESTNFIIEEAKLSLWQKIKNLGVFGVVLVVLGFIFPPFGAILMLVWKRVSGTLKKAVENANTQMQNIKDEKDELTGDAKLIVKSVDEGLAAIDATIAAARGRIEASPSNIEAQAVLTAVTNLKRDFLSAMSRKQDSTTKLLVAELKND